MKKYNYLNKYIKKISGNVIGIGINNDEIINSLKNNDSILNCDLLNSKTIDKSNSKGGKTKVISVKKIRKKYRKKTINYMIINIDEINKYLKTFIRDSIYITSNEIIYYMDKKYDIDSLIKKYNRYNTKIEIIRCEDANIIKINSENAKNNYIKDKIYYVVDTANNISDFISDILIN